VSIRIALADDHEIVRQGFRALLKVHSEVEVVGEAGNGREAVALALRLKPDVILMDVSMPDLNGVDATAEVRRLVPQTRVVGLSMNASRRVVLDMLRAGASGYLVKTCMVEELLHAVRAVHAGKTYLSPDVAGAVLSDCVGVGGTSHAAAPLPLTPREREILQLVAEGKSTKEIAATLHSAVKTVETHRGHIMRKLNLRSVAELTKYAVREGLTPLER
jgi:DNA-binding NarL/FixJ family response regulator